MELASQMCTRTLLCPKCDINWMSQCGRNAAVSVCKVGDSGSRCTQYSHKQQGRKPPDHQQPDGTTIQVLYLAPSTYRSCRTKVWVLFQGASTSSLHCFTFFWPGHTLGGPAASPAATIGAPDGGLIYGPRKKRYSTSIGNSGCATPITCKHRPLGSRTVLLHTFIPRFVISVTYINFWFRGVNCSHPVPRPVEPRLESKRTVNTTCLTNDVVL